MTWGIRNVVTSGLLQRLLGNGIHVKLIVRKSADFQSLLPNSPQLEVLPLLAPRPKTRVWGYYLLNMLRNATFSYRNGTYREKKKLVRLLSQQASRQIALATLMEALGKISYGVNAEAFLDQAWLGAYLKKNDLSEIKAQLQQSTTDMLYSTTNVNPTEYPYVLAAQQLGIPSVASILSFDNLTSRGKSPSCDYYFVWNTKMRDNALNTYRAIAPERVYVTGTPQFDFHKKEEFKWTREETMKHLGLPPTARYILYAANFYQWTPSEPELINQLFDKLQQEKNLKDLWLVVRLHPLDKLERWKDMVRSGRKIAVSYPWVAKVDADGWALVGADDQKLLVSTLTHSEMCINMCSTMSLDAAILDKPVICITFSAFQNTAEDKVYKEVYQQYHYRSLVASGGISMAHNWQELLGHIRLGLQAAANQQAQRRQMVENECGTVDGHAADRIASLLTKLLQEGK